MASKPASRDAGAAAGSLEEVVRDRGSIATVKDLALRLRRQQVQGSFAVADATARTMRGVVSSAKYWQLEELVRMIRITGRYLQDALPSGASPRGVHGHN